MWTTDHQLRITAARGAVLAELGFSEAAVLGQPIEALGVSQADRALIGPAHRRALSGETVVYERTRHQQHFAARVGPLRDPQRAVIGCIGLAIDVTEQRRIDQTRRRDLIRLEALHAIDEAILYARGPEGIAAATLTVLAGLVPYRGAAVLLEDPQTGQEVLLAARGQELAADLVGQLVLPLIARSTLIGTLRLLPQQPLFTPDQIALVQNINRPLAIALQEARLMSQVIAGRERLQVLSRRLVAVQEEERRAIARELHDEIGQSLTGLKFVLELAARSAEPAGGIADAQTIVEDLVRHVRELSLNLRPAMLDDLGLIATLHWHIERYSAQTGIAVDFTHDAPGRFPAEYETAIYRIAQEALTNVARHAGATQVRVQLWADAAMLGVQIADGGRGFEAEPALASHASSGLAGMRERVLLLGGRLTLNSAPGGGTQVTAELPLDGQFERRAQERT